MNDLKPIIAANLTELRHRADMTQLDLAEALHYSDKAVSKWERGESVPDVAVLKEIADLFGVTVDYLLTEDHPAVSQTAPPDPAIEKQNRKNRTLISLLATALVWMIASLLFLFFRLIAPPVPRSWLCFVFAIPVSAVVLLVFNSIWGNRRRNYVILSVLIWSLLLSLFLLLLDYGAWMLFILGIPGQIIILLWSGLRPKERTDTK